MLRVFLVLCLFGCQEGSHRTTEAFVVEGRVTDSDENPIESAHIEVAETIHITNLTDNNEGFEEHRGTLGQGWSGSDGFFKLEITTGRQPTLKEILVTKSSFVIYRSPISLGADSAAKILEVKLDRQIESNPSLNNAPLIEVGK